MPKVSTGLFFFPFFSYFSTVVWNYGKRGAGKGEGKVRAMVVLDTSVP